ncbi:MAG: diguanylate cyclase [Rhodocyclaceae bacterium]|nr:diguanylate cyclase [Rhodocyclaceae bacterium]
MSAAVEQPVLAYTRLFACFQHLNAVAIARVREDGQLLQANAGFRRLLALRTAPLANDVTDFFVLPRFSLLVATLPTAGQTIHSGVLNVGDESLVCRSLIGTVLRDGEDLIVIGEYDVAEMEQLNAQVVQLNEQLTETQRELARNARRLRASEDRLRELSFTDPLTGLANRRRLDEFLQNEYQRAQRYDEVFSIIMADLDHFKQVNDRHGHDTGDVVLCKFAQLLREHRRETDLVARSGGEEFIVIMPMTDLAAASITAERLRHDTLQMTFPAIPEGVSASFGVAQFAPGDTVPGLLQHADAALYAAKNAGRNRVEAFVPG